MPDSQRLESRQPQQAVGKETESAISAHSGAPESGRTVPGRPQALHQLRLQLTRSRARTITQKFII